MGKRTALIAGEKLGQIAADVICEAIANGLRQAGWQTALLPEQKLTGKQLNELLITADVVVVASEELNKDSLIGTFLSQVATGARQAGAPCHAVVAKNNLDDFGLRQLDLQYVEEVGSSVTPAKLAAKADALGQKLLEDFGY